MSEDGVECTGNIWSRIASTSRSAHVCHEAGAAAHAAGHTLAAHALYTAALEIVREHADTAVCTHPSVTMFRLPLELEISKYYVMVAWK